jgi:hypothetical protein
VAGRNGKSHRLSDGPPGHRVAGTVGRMGSAPAGSVRNAWGSLAVLAAVAVIAFGLPLLDRALPSAQTLPEGRPYDVGASISVVPPGGARVDVTGTRPGPDRGTALFLVGGVRLLVVVSPYQGSLPAAADRLAAKITHSTGFQVARAGQPIRSSQGVSGLLGGYASPGRLGEYAVFVAGDRSVELTASGPENELRANAPALAASVQSVLFGAAR